MRPCDSNLHIYKCLFTELLTKGCTFSRIHCNLQYNTTQDYPNETVMSEITMMSL